MNKKKVVDYIVKWLTDYLNQAGSDGYVVGVSGGVDSALTSALAALTNKTVVLVTMPIKQSIDEIERGNLHIKKLVSEHQNCIHHELDLNRTFAEFQKIFRHPLTSELAFANSRSRLRMVVMYQVAASMNLLVCGTGNKIEDFGIGFFFFYGDGGVDVSPIADLYKSEVYDLAKYLKVDGSILKAMPTDGLWDDGRIDEDQIGATYKDLERVMKIQDKKALSNDDKQVYEIFLKLHNRNLHKMSLPPVCKIPTALKT